MPGEVVVIQNPLHEGMTVALLHTSPATRSSFDVESVFADVEESALLSKRAVIRVAKYFRRLSRVQFVVEESHSRSQPPAWYLDRLTLPSTIPGLSEWSQGPLKLFGEQLATTNKAAFRVWYRGVTVALFEDLDDVPRSLKDPRRETERDIAALDGLGIRRGDNHAVTSYLGKNPHLSSLLRDARGEIDKVFGAGTPLTLDVMHDPEDGSDQLYLLIGTKFDADKAGELLDRLDREWWLGAVRRARGKLAIALAFE